MTPDRSAPVPVAQDGLPPWAIVTPARRAHVERVALVLRGWATALDLDRAERDRWLRACYLHDALRDAPEAEMRRWAPHIEGPVELRHGPAAAARAELEGEQDADVLSAVRWHSVGWVGWGPTGRALYCADFLEPGRDFDRAERHLLAEQFSDAPAKVLREVVTRRLAYAERQGWELPPESLEFRRMVGA